MLKLAGLYGTIFTWYTYSDTGVSSTPLKIYLGSKASLQILLSDELSRRQLFFSSFENNVSDVIEWDK